MYQDELTASVRAVVNNPHLTFHHRKHQLAALAESTLEYPAVSTACRGALEKQIICDLFEGPAPYRPRYLLVDYEKALRQGSAYLELDPPTDLEDALSFLLILYTQVPSITGYPVYLGNLDLLLEPFVEEVSTEQMYRSLRRFWIALDRMLPDAFVHTNIGPADSRVARMILRLERELLQVVPNVTLKVDAHLTPDDLIEDAVKTVFVTGKPHFVNHELMTRDLGESYGVVSCYNSLKVGGGSHTLVRLNLKEVALQHTGDVDGFLTETLRHYVELCAELAESRIRYLVEEAAFFEHDFLAREGLVELDRFSAMFGIYGLAECVNLLMSYGGSDATYGHSDEANEVSYAIVREVANLVAARPMPYCEGNGGRCFLHAQSGIDTDIEVSAGTRIPIGDEPDLRTHIHAVAPHHDLFAAGVSDIFHLDDTAQRNPEAVVDIIRGAFSQGMRDFTFNLATNGFIRITGYLVRKSDVVSFEECGARHGSTTFAAGSVKNSNVENRNMKRVGIRERSASRPYQ